MQMLKKDGYGLFKPFRKVVLVVMEIANYCIDSGERVTLCIKRNVIHLTTFNK